MTLVLQIAGGILLAAAVIVFLLWVFRPDDHPEKFP
jgi:hypothetical protein